MCKSTRTSIRFELHLDCKSECSFDSYNHALNFIPKYIYPYLPSGPVHPYQLDESISNFRGLWCTFLFLYYFEIEIPVSEQGRPWSDAAESHLGLHCWHMSQKLDTSLIWVKLSRFTTQLFLQFSNRTLTYSLNIKELSQPSLKNNVIRTWRISMLVLKRKYTKSQK